MPSFRTSLHSGDRPQAVAVIAALCGLLAAGSTLFALLLFLDRVPLSAGAFLLGGGLEQLGPTAFLLNAAVSTVIVVGLLRRSRWSRWAVIAFAAVGVLLAIPAISSAVMDTRVLSIVREGVQIIVRVSILYYMTQAPVKAWFS